MNPPVPASTRIRRSRVGNMDVARLARRYAFLLNLVHNESHTFTTRHNFAVRAAELQAVQNELRLRRMPFA